MKETQQARNPFVNSDTNKRYYTYDYYLRRTFGDKCLKVALDIGCTCPNMDGTCGTGGCIYCSGRGSGDFAPAPLASVTAQIEAGKRQLAAKWQSNRVIPYFQAHSNTYGDLNRLRAAYFEAIAYPGTVGVSIATRADCLGDAVLALLAEVAAKTRLTVELGLQSASDATAARINRGHDFAAFCAGFAALRRADGGDLYPHHQRASRRDARRYAGDRRRRGGVASESGQDSFFACSARHGACRSVYARQLCANLA